MAEKKDLWDGLRDPDIDLLRRQTEKALLEAIGANARQSRKAADEPADSDASIGEAHARAALALAQTLSSTLSSARR